jgi:hypothetical protein
MNLFESPRPRFTLVVRHPGVLAKLLDPPDELILGELFIRRDLDVEGDLEAALQLAESLMSHPPRSREQERPRRFAATPPHHKPSLHGRDEGLQESSLPRARSGCHRESL